MWVRVPLDKSHETGMSKQSKQLASSLSTSSSSSSLPPSYLNFKISFCYMRGSHFFPICSNTHQTQIRVRWGTWIRPSRLWWCQMSRFLASVTQRRLALYAFFALKNLQNFNKSWEATTTTATSQKPSSKLELWVTVLPSRILNRIWIYIIYVYNLFGSFRPQKHNGLD